VAGRCEDGDPCTAAVCDAQGGCRQVPSSGAACDDGDACTTIDRCLDGHCVGQPVRCPADAFACTEEECVAGACRSVARSERCAAAECAVAECRPDARNADRRGCVTTPLVDGTPCTDDGAYCTDDACEAGSCLHVPIDGRCASADECTRVVCAPERNDRDTAGCVPGAASEPECAEDGDPCSDDVCQEARCTHAPVSEVDLCAPIRGIFRRTLGLGALARELLASLTEVPDVDAHPLAERLQRLDGGLTEAALILSGRVDVPARPRPRVVEETSAQRRARAAAASLAGAPRAARVLTRVMRGRESRDMLGRERAVTLRRRMRELARGIVALKADLARVQQVQALLAH
jgi:hypothetical protein